LNSFAEKENYKAGRWQSPSVTLSVQKRAHAKLNIDTGEQW